MLVGLIGSGNMARALARGWGEPVLVTDAGSGRAAELAGELGGEALRSNAELAERADLIVLCHKPAQLDEVAAEIAGKAKAVASVLGATSVAALQAAYPGTPVFRFMPNTPVEVRRGVLCYAPAPAVDATLEAAVLERFGRLGVVVEVDESQFELATALMGCGPAYVALVAEAQIDAAVERGMARELAARLVAETLAGTAELLRARDLDVVAVRRQVASPGGMTERGLAALEASGIRAAFAAATDAVAGKPAR